jgi:hypothetical protein
LWLHVVWRWWWDEGVLLLSWHTELVVHWGRRGVHRLPTKLAWRHHHWHFIVESMLLHWETGIEIHSGSGVRNRHHGVEWHLIRVTHGHRHMVVLHLILHPRLIDFRLFQVGSFDCFCLVI